MKKNAIYEQVEASKRFNPYTLKNYLILTDENLVIVDRKSLLKEPNDIRLFYIILNKDYKWGYRYADTTTIYFKIEDGQVIGGVYEDTYGIRTKQVIAVPRNRAKRYDYNVYAYDPDVLKEIIENILRVKEVE